MILTGKAKEEFEKWFVEEYKPNSGRFLHSLYELPMSYRWGVYLDFFDSKGIELTILPVFREKCGYDSFKRDGYTYEVVLVQECQHLSWEQFNQAGEEIDNAMEEYGNEDSPIKPSVKSRREAQIQALERANGLYNISKT